MTASTTVIRLALAEDITETSVIRLGYTDYPVSELNLYVTPSGARSLQFPGEQGRRTFLPLDPVTLVDPAEGGAR
jgi:hypothetical protein